MGVRKRGVGWVGVGAWLRGRGETRLGVLRTIRHARLDRSVSPARVFRRPHGGTAVRYDPGVTIELAVVDGPNLFNRVGSLLRNTLDDRLRNDIKPYLVEWFDLDRMLAWHLDVELALDTSIVHSERPLGRDLYRLNTDEARRFWRRQATLAGCRSVSINIGKGDQEVHDGECNECGAPVALRSTREKGVDVAVASELFARGSWSKAALVSTDTDLAPAVRILAQQNRQVICLGTSSADPTELHVQASEFRELDPDWFHGDLATYRLARCGGVFDSLSTLLEQHQLRFAFQWVSDAELDLTRGQRRVQLGIWHAGRRHSDIVSLLKATLDHSGWEDALRVEERNEDITIVHAIPREGLLALAVERRKTPRPAWVENVRSRGVFEVVYPRRSRDSGSQQ